MKKQLEISSPLRATKKHKTEKSSRNRNDNLSHSFISGTSHLQTLDRLNYFQNLKSHYKANAKTLTDFGNLVKTNSQKYFLKYSQEKPQQQYFDLSNGQTSREKIQDKLQTLKKQNQNSTMISNEELIERLTQQLNRSSPQSKKNQSGYQFDNLLNAYNKLSIKYAQLKSEKIKLQTDKVNLQDKFEDLEYKYTQIYNEFVEMKYQINIQEDDELQIKEYDKEINNSNQQTIIKLQQENKEQKELINQLKYQIDNIENKNRIQYQKQIEDLKHQLNYYMNRIKQMNEQFSFSNKK